MTQVTNTALPSADEREMLREAVRDALSQAWPAQSYRQSIEDPQRLIFTWRQLCQQGLATLGGDPAEGGLRELAVVMEELGRAACPAPLAASALANFALRSHPELSGLLKNIHQGEAILAVSFANTDRAATAESLLFNGDTVSGVLNYVEGAELATHFLIFCANDSAAILSRMQTGVSVEATRAMGATGLGRVTLAGARATMVRLTGVTAGELLDISRIALAARSYGETVRTFELVTDYVKERRQFGRPVGSFQAIQHKLVDNHITLEGCRLIIAHAAQCYDLCNAHWRYYAAVSFGFAAATLRQLALQNHHAFGAIGYAEEHEAPRHFKQIHVDLLRHGGSRACRADAAAYYLDSDHAVPEIDLGPAGNRFREEVRQWLEKSWPRERAEHFHDRPFHEREYSPEFAAELGATGWIALAWPKRFGGQERGPLEHIAFLEMMEQYDAPRVGAPIQAPMFMVHGTPEQQARYLPEIRDGLVYYGMAFSEPNSGSDLASLKTRAVRDGDSWVITGEKIWCTSYRGHQLLVAARTDPDAQPQHAGISAFVLPRDSPGLTIKPTATLYDGRFANLFFDGVRVPHASLIGAVNDGWKVITGALSTERGYLGGIIIMQVVRMFDLLCQHLRREAPKLCADPLVRDKIGELALQIEVGRRMMISCAYLAQGGVTPPQDGAMSKVYAGELLERFGEAALEILGLQATLSYGSPGAILRGRFEQKLRHSLMWVISVGTNEIQRNLIAKLGLGLPAK